MMNRNKRATEFVVFCIENTADRLGVSGRTVFNCLEKAGGISGFLYPSYNTLHTQSKEYIVDEILTYMKDRKLNLNPSL